MSAVLFQVTRSEALRIFSQRGPIGELGSGKVGICGPGNCTDPKAPEAGWTVGCWNGAEVEVRRLLNREAEA